VRVEFGQVRTDQPAEGLTPAAAGALDQRPLTGDRTGGGGNHAAKYKRPPPERTGRQHQATYEAATA
jgi:hypothetical protein